MALLDALARFVLRGPELERLLRPPHAAQIASAHHHTDFRRLGFHETQVEYRASFGLDFRNGGGLTWSLALTWSDSWFINGRVTVRLMDAPYQVLLATPAQQVASDVLACVQAVDAVGAALWAHAAEFLKTDDFSGLLTWAASQPTFHNV
ncbi:hypothetical protein GO986_00350 [Deinococcus sp. HMF7620]|uniref:Uncharacterized protein n=1 Tax=Deinococcus arboris TaxID=2682977 RepID=A0A7C9LR06_9DEIO|nr:hypothetical protein [Deinococcus arboris]MVN85220.1 hypothetical protein [Deinococcus arboris]